MDRAESRTAEDDVTRRALVLSCSAGHYNLGAHKLVDWLRSEGWHVAFGEADQPLHWRGKRYRVTVGETTEVVPSPGSGEQAPLFVPVDGYDLVALSVVFSWHAPVALDIAQRVRANTEVWCGGPGVSALANWWEHRTAGLHVTTGLDWRFERQRGTYEKAFAARGCPVKCWFCIVPKIEGEQFTLDPDFQPAPVLSDNNLSALPVEFQEHIIRRYVETGTRLEDAESGFEPRAFDEGTFRRWRAILRGPWRFAFDEEREAADVENTMRILRAAGVVSKRQRVYVLAGNEPVEACYARAMRVIGWGGEPHCQYVLPLNWLGDPATLRPRADWTYRLGRDFCRYFNRRAWRGIPIEEYRPRYNEPPPFAFLARRPARAKEVA